MHFIVVIWLTIPSLRKGIFSATKTLAILILCFVLRDWKIVIVLYILNALLCLLFSHLVLPKYYANDCHDEIIWDKLSEVEEVFSYEYDINEIGLGFEDRSTRKTD